jgi:hypothetical protein
MLITSLKKIFLKFGYNLSSATKEAKIKYFFSSIRPLTTNIPLIRIGEHGDAGYLIPDDLDGIKYCFSPGVSNEISFEEALSKRGITSFMADYSVEGPPTHNPNFIFLKKFLGFEHNESFISLYHWMNMYPETLGEDMILQMDIEGSEYSVLSDVSSEYLQRFRMIIIEFHQLDALLNAQAFDKIASCFYKLLKDFVIVHIHPNNCSKTVKYLQYEMPLVAEFTFLRKDRVKSSSFTSSFPHHLDSPNILNNKDLVLPACFYKM